MSWWERHPVLTILAAILFLMVCNAIAGTP